jgi:hypothetical protein
MMGIDEGTICMVRDVAVVTVDLGRTEVLGPIHGHQQIPVDRAVGIQMSPLLQRVHGARENRKHRAGWDWIEPMADVVVARGLRHPEQAPGVATSPRHLRGTLEIQERWTLGEKHRERPDGGIRHRIHHIITRAIIRKLLNG